MQVSFHQTQGVTVTPSGLFDYSAGQECIPQVEAILQEAGAVQLTVDFTHTTGIDSSGVGGAIDPSAQDARFRAPRTFGEPHKTSAKNP